MDTYVRVIQDVLGSLARGGFRRVLLVSGHGGNTPASAVARDWSAAHGGMQVRCYSWWDAPRTGKKVKEIDPVGMHASWTENYPWTRLDGSAAPDVVKPPVDYPRLRLRAAEQVREALGDGSFGGRYQRSDEEMLANWEVAVAETREGLEEGWLWSRPGAVPLSGPPLKASRPRMRPGGLFAWRGLKPRLSARRSRRVGRCGRPGLPS